MSLCDATETKKGEVQKIVIDCDYIRLLMLLDYGILRPSVQPTQPLCSSTLCLECQSMFLPTETAFDAPYA